MRIHLCTPILVAVGAYPTHVWGATMSGPSDDRRTRVRENMKVEKEQADEKGR